MGVVRIRFLFVALCITSFLFGQTAPETYWVQFTSKAGTPYSLALPGEYLSQRAIERRQRQGIAIDSLDLPIDPANVDALMQWGQFELVNRSKWMNAVTIRTTDTLALDTLAFAPFLQQMRMVQGGPEAGKARSEKFPVPAKNEVGGYYHSIYGKAYRQVSMMNLHLLHDQGGARGEGMLIGVLDSGFDGVDSSATFAALRDRGGIVHTQDLAYPGSDVYQEHWHGRSVLSTMAGQLPGEYLGTAPMANYALFRTEVESSEYIWEEDNWIAGAEVADSLGCDVLNTSLGYTQFDDSLTDHTYADLDGMTTRISIAAGIAARKGMIPVNSAGNSGQGDWYYIGAPADAFDILAVGAVNNDRQVAAFSSRGPSADGRVKPDVSAVGSGTMALSPWGEEIIAINGTSFSSPVTAGGVACLWQLHQDRTAQQVMQAVRESASQWDGPNDSIGFGIPDLWRAHLLLGGEDLTGLVSTDIFSVRPVPFTDHFVVDMYAGDATVLEMRLVDMSGRVVWSKYAPVESRVYTLLRVGDEHMQRIDAGMYVLQLLMGDVQQAMPVVKAMR